MGQAVKDVIELLTSVPPFPKAIMKLIQLLGDDTATSTELGEVISSDPALTIKILHMANSPFYMCSRRINSVEEAVIVLGIGTIKSISTSAAMQHSMKKLMPPTHVIDISSFWTHSFATAIAARQLADKVKDLDKDICFVAGLTYDIGKVIQARHWPEAWKSAIIHTIKAKVEFEEVESQYFGFSCQDLAIQLCEQWGFPQTFMNLISGSLTLSEALKDPVQINGLVTLADGLAHTTGYSFPTPKRSDALETLRTTFMNIVDDMEQEVSHQLKILD